MLPYVTVILPHIEFAIKVGAVEFGLWTDERRLHSTIYIWYYTSMIASFADPEAKLIFEGKRSRKLPPDMQALAFRKLGYIDDAQFITDLREPPGNRLEKLIGDRSGQWSVRVNNQWRICFNWIERHADLVIHSAQLIGDAYDVEIVDYH